MKSKKMSLSFYFPRPSIFTKHIFHHRMLQAVFFILPVQNIQSRLFNRKDFSWEHCIHLTDFPGVIAYLIQLNIILILRHIDTMIPLNKRTAVFILFILFFKIGNTQNLFDSANSKKFAGYLQNTHQFELAVHEYERILSVNPEDTGVFINLMESYRFGNDCNAFQRLEQLKVRRYIHHPSIASEYLKLSIICNANYNNAVFSEALAVLDPAEKAFYEMGRYIFSEDRESLVVYAGQNAGILNTYYPDIYANAKSIEGMKRKSPFLAASMSAVIPGSGKAYSEFWGDALMSFIFVTSNAWLSYRGFKKNGLESATGWIFGSISFGFYSGNIFGSARAARYRNKASYKILYDDAKNNYYKRF